MSLDRKRRALDVHYSVFSVGALPEDEMTVETERRARARGLEPINDAPMIETHELKDGFAVVIASIMCQPIRPKWLRPPRTPSGYIPQVRQVAGTGRRRRGGAE